MGPIEKKKKTWTPRTYKDKLAWDHEKSADYRDFFKKTETIVKLKELTDEAANDPEASLTGFNDLLR